MVSDEELEVQVGKGGSKAERDPEDRFERGHIDN